MNYYTRSESYVALTAYTRSWNIQQFKQKKVEYGSYQINTNEILYFNISHKL